MSELLVAVEFDTHDGVTTRTLRLSNKGPLLATVGPARVQYLPILSLPILLGSRISQQTFGEAERAAPNGGNVVFALDAATQPFLSNHWIGREFRVYSGDFDDGHAGLSLIYRGRVANLSTDDSRMQVSVGTTDMSHILEAPLVADDLYADTNGTVALRGKPRPQLWGERRAIDPVLEDDAALRYRVSRTALAAVDEVRVGGIPWDFAGSSPKAGQWTADLAAGTITLGGTPLDGEIRVDAKADGYDTLTTAALIRAIVEQGGGTVDDASMTALDVEIPALVGFYTSTEPVNILDALDAITSGMGCLWGVGSTGEVFAKGLAAPDAVADTTLGTAEIGSMQLSRRDPPAWRVQVEYAGNQSPASQFYDAVTDAERQAMAATGIIAPAQSDATIKTAEPLAVDVPVIHSPVLTEDDAVAIRNRLWAAWNVPRDTYESTAWNNQIGLYDTVATVYPIISSRFRALSSIWSIGGGASQYEFWG